MCEYPSTTASNTTTAGTPETVVSVSGAAWPPIAKARLGIVKRIAARIIRVEEWCFMFDTFDASTLTVKLNPTIPLQNESDRQRRGVTIAP